MAIFKWIVRVLLASVFITTGAIKLTPNLSQGIHDHMGKEFIKFATVFPLKYIGLTIGPERYMRITGIVEVTCAPFLIIGSGSLRTLTGLALTVTMLVAIYTLYALQYKPAEFIPAIVCLGLLILDGYFLDIDANYGGFDTKRTKLS